MTDAYKMISALSSARAAATTSEARNRPIPHEAAAAERQALRKLPFDKAHNFRDIGGYETTQQQRVKWGLLYRADKLSSLSEEDIRYFQRLKIRRVVDFRSIEERESSPHSPELSAISRIEAMSVPVEAAEIERIISSLQQENVSPDSMSQFLVRANREMVEKHTPIYRRWMQSLLDSDNYPTVFHCTAGKDRTGFAAALLLSALDVPFEQIMEDYLATNAYTAQRVDDTLMLLADFPEYQVPDEVVRTLFQVKPDYLNEAFKTINQHYGELQNYFEAGLGIGETQRAVLRQKLLES